MQLLGGCGASEPGEADLVAPLGRRDTPKRRHKGDEVNRLEGPPGMSIRETIRGSGGFPVLAGLTWGLG